ncbi:glycoside hydrolase/deacetylase [Paenibacillus sp. 32O-W]|uniref:polysaccharide deacetylase family protein n=1 Tax=Paenibacillus sp. 32O-W TaxID=1695218 RepID=UPI000720536B|nr:polysaccharide deacetylase family protein [Paenibacillus sp. 32O-W]ALS26349.1 glycoside hydrolase/deacetylase [Paenibacillus sp. 32O-W]
MTNRIWRKPLLTLLLMVLTTAACTNGGKIPADGTAAEGGSPPSPSVTHTGGAPADSNGAPNEGGLDGRPGSDGGAANGNAGSDGGTANGNANSDGGTANGNAGSDGGTANGNANSDGGRANGNADSDGGTANGNAGSDGGAPDRPGVSTPEADAGGNTAGSGDPGADPGTAPGTDPGAVSGTVPETGGNGVRDDRPDESDEGLVPYDGVVEHLFFHPLIAYPELAFDGDAMSDGYNNYFTTVPEFKRMLEALYERDFILVDLNDVYEEKKVNGKLKLTKKTMMLPPGKKPLVISIDDLNYYEYMIENGNVFKLVLDEDGNVATWSKTPDGEEIVSRDNEIVPILDLFVEEHPDFSFRGAKGVLALTGYEGVLGYRTQSGSPDRESEIAAAKPVIERLKETGWVFGSHSYGHINVPNVSLTRLKQDTAKWKREVGSLVGDTALFIYPYGARVDPGDAKFDFLVASGYKVLSAVGPTSYTKVQGGAYTMDRRHMDGIALIEQQKTLADLFDPDAVLDRDNRPRSYWEKKPPHKRP